MKSNNWASVFSIEINGVAVSIYFSIYVLDSTMEANQSAYDTLDSIVEV